jgi:hypothetical protein
MLDEYSGFGWTGSLVEGIPIVTLKPSAGKVLTSGKHQFKIVNNNDTESNAVFMKIGRPSTDDSSSKRYKLTLPKTITVIS